jgi:hypothetical protein
MYSQMNPLIRILNFKRAVQTQGIEIFQCVFENSAQLAELVMLPVEFC